MKIGIIRTSHNGLFLSRPVSGRRFVSFAAFVSLYSLMAALHYELAEDPGIAWHIISSIIGWTYFAAWSVSFYPQAILNWKRKSVQGLSLDFLNYNVLGFLCYSIFNLSFYFSKEIQDEYKRRNHEQANLVRANDVMFAVHAFLISSFTLLQTFIYKKEQGQRVSTLARIIICMIFIGIAVSIARVYFANAMWIDVMYYLSYVKLFISFIKYLPQAWLNYKRKSTVGWSIHNILLDFTGGALSIAQLLLDAALSGDWSGVSGVSNHNPFRVYSK
ncbi:PQ loop repeat-domain-containing protein [Radiomyces spectabilis]|uniref:PQ loop repeat-domain-containing protein n=1 Tax=Radiomyces spectabilis TaxID=64574 RepID=UPI0022205BDF|nr:PQ loop repeat-domain-containing protein [Radiomyces spectabilis]KAI8368151.1 PQ loop repeat-domain-containing protein [Radiomyces spectabilis]